jgi:hypothetical protein
MTRSFLPLRSQEGLELLNPPADGVLDELCPAGVAEFGALHQLIHPSKELLRKLDGLPPALGGSAHLRVILPMRYPYMNIEI